MMEQHPVIAPKKLIEVALPLDSINDAAASEKSSRKEHPSTMHLWWARRPLAAARAVIFAQMVNDPSWRWELESPEAIPPGNLKASWASSRNRLFAIIKELVNWENIFNEAVLERARSEIRKSWQETCEINRKHPCAANLFDPDKLPAFHDPFAGGGALPLEAQRLGLEAHASDLNPVAVLINKALIEIPSKFANQPPVNPEARNSEDAWSRSWIGAQGLADDVRYYGRWMREKAESRIGHLYPPVVVANEMAKNRADLKPYIGKKLKVIAWIWARTVPSPSPAFSDVMVPLVSNFILDSRNGRETWIEPIVDRQNRNIKYRIRHGGTKEELMNAARGTTAGKRLGFRCIFSDSAMPYDHIRNAGKEKCMGQALLAIVAKGKFGRVYIEPLLEHEKLARTATPEWKPTTPLPNNPRNFNTPIYGLKNFGDLFTDRQLVALTTFTDLLFEVRGRIKKDAHEVGLEIDDAGLDKDGSGTQAYAESVILYLAFALDRIAMSGNNLVRWNSAGPKAQHCFGRQSLPMIWDFAEVNLLAESTGSIKSSVYYTYSPLNSIYPKNKGFSTQANAASQSISCNKVISTDPPYYDNISYADLSDFFIVWLRKSLKSFFPSIFSTIVAPKDDEIIANPYRNDGKEKAEAFFLEGMTNAMKRLCMQAHPSLPITIYYAFKQSKTNSESETVSRGWETFLDAVIQAGFCVTGTWPMRTEMKTRQIAMDANALASSIVLVCRRRQPDAISVSRRVFIRELNKILPEALDKITRGAGDERSPVAPVDLSQAIIGPGMAVFSKYAAVLEANGSQMSVRTALELINRFLSEGDFDNDTQFCLHWFEQYGWKEGMFDDAHTLARAKGTSVDDAKQAGILDATGGVVRLLMWKEYCPGSNMQSDEIMPVWKALHHLIREFKTNGEGGAGKILAAFVEKAEPTRNLAYRLYTLCDRAGWSEDARAYDEIVTSWNAIESAARSKQPELFE